MKARTRKTKATTMQRAWTASPRRNWISVGRYRRIAPSNLFIREIGEAFRFSFVSSPVIW